MSDHPNPTPQVIEAGLALDGEGTCPMCGGTGGWPGLDAHVVCEPCGGTGLDGEALFILRSD